MLWKNRARYVRHSPKVDFSNWGFPVDIEKEIRDSVTKAIKNVLIKNESDFGVCVRLPFIWSDSDGMGGKPVSDPATFDISIELGSGADSGPVWRIMLKNIIDAEFFDRERDTDEDVLKFRDRLRELADYIDRQLKRGR